MYKQKDMQKYKNYFISLQDLNYLNKIIKQHPDKQWEHDRIIRSPNTLINFKIFERFDKMNCRFNMRYNINVSTLTVEQIEEYHIYYTRRSYYIHAPLEFIIKYKNNKYYNIFNTRTCFGASDINDITMQFILDNLDKTWFWGTLSGNKNITFQDILNNPTLSWNWRSISTRDDITIDNIINNLDKQWNFKAISSCAFIKYKDILKFPQFLLIWFAFNNNCKVQQAINIINNYSKIDDKTIIGILYVNRGNISKHPKLTIQDILNNPTFEWDWKLISDNPSITTSDIVNNPNLPWNLRSLSFNGSITPKFIKMFIDELDITGLSSNKFVYDDIVFNRHYKKYKKYINKMLINKTNLCNPIINDMLEFI